MKASSSRFRLPIACVVVVTLWCLLACHSTCVNHSGVQDGVAPPKSSLTTSPDESISIDDLISDLMSAKELSRSEVARVLKTTKWIERREINEQREFALEPVRKPFSEILYRSGERSQVVLIGLASVVRISNAPLTQKYGDPSTGIRHGEKGGMVYSFSRGQRQLRIAGQRTDDGLSFETDEFEIDNYGP